jgi:hypothetical protein
MSIASRFLLAAAVASFVTPALAGSPKHKVELPTEVLGMWCLEEHSEEKPIISKYVRKACRMEDQPEYVSPKFMVLDPRGNTEEWEAGCKVRKLAVVVKDRTWDFEGTCFTEGVEYDVKSRIWYVNGELTIRTDWVSPDREAK